MLLQLYRYGPIRQRIQKGFIIDGSISEDDIKRLFADLNLSFGHLRLDQNRKHVVWLDTGMVWLHTAQAREQCFQQLQDSIQIIATTVKSNGGILVPNAVRTSTKSSWDDFVCGDRHLLEITDVVEKEVTCNLLRLHVPTMVAFAGRGGLEKTGLERIGSRRLFISQEHFAARYLISLAPNHLERVKQCLRRDDGVSNLDYLDINPLNENGQDPSIELRFLDGQAFLSTARAQALLIQALFIRARRLVREGRRVGDPDQKYLERNRARAISQSMQARFEKEPDRRIQQQNRKGRYEIQKEYISAETAWSNLVESLHREFQILEVEYSEIAPLILGTSLQQMGYAGVRNENDYFQVMSKTTEWQGNDWISQITNHYTEQQGYQLSPMQSINEERYPSPAQLVRRWWTLALRYDPKRTRKIKQPDRTSKPSRRADSSSLRSASYNLASALKKLGDDYSNYDLRLCLQVFGDSSGGNEINRGLGVIPFKDAQFVRRTYRSLKGQFKLHTLEKGWEDEGARKVLSCTRRYGLGLLSFMVSQQQEDRARSTIVHLQETLPSDLKVYILSYWKFKARKSGKLLLKVEIVVAKPAENKPS